MGSNTLSPQERRSSFATVLVAEAAERAGFYGVDAILLLFMVQQLGITDHRADLMVGAFAAMTYATPLLGGWIGDCLYGPRWTAIFGTLLLSAGYALLACTTLTSRSFFEPALALVATGNGLFKPNAAQLVRRLYEKYPLKRDSAFTLYYMAANVGSALSMFLIPWVRNTFDPLLAFSLCVAGPACALFILLTQTGTLRDLGILTRQSVSLKRATAFGTGSVILCILSVTFILYSTSLARLAVFSCLTLVFILWATLYRRATPSERLSLVTLGIMLIQSIAFYCFYQQMQTSLTQFALTNVDGTFRILGHRIVNFSAAQFQALDPLFIILFSSPMAGIYNVLSRRNRDVSLPTKFAIGFGFVVVAFFIWWGGIHLAAGNLTSAWFMAGGYLALAMAEVLIGGLGLAVVAKYAPASLNGIMVGAYYLTVGAGMYLGSEIASKASSTAMSQAVQSQHYENLFGILCLCALALALLTLFLAQQLNRMEKRISGKNVSNTEI
ncbi:MFS transporter [Acetobacter musti]|uniref:MFS transporter n=1 Tax=Acetobacter musti TaxID=864732 RepID=A0ABX0JSS1_9PROT|nr:oligopeptide:H+ symporter [Acetobacter musti]NHN86536.1 MFS transporter [Acetobacter musti]